MKRALSAVAILVAALVMYLYLWRTTNVATPPPRENTVADKLEDQRKKEEAAEARADPLARTDRAPAEPSKAEPTRDPALADAAAPTEGERAAERTADRSGDPATPSVDGGNPIYAPTNTGIRDAVRASIPELKECYESWLKMSPELKGKTTFSFAIVTDATQDAGTEALASIRDVKLQSSTLGHAFMEGCLARVFEDLRFQPPAGGRLEVTYPLMFDNLKDQ